MRTFFRIADKRTKLGKCINKQEQFEYSAIACTQINETNFSHWFVRERMQKKKRERKKLFLQNGERDKLALSLPFLF
jgi:hypothetical protein